MASGTDEKYFEFIRRYPKGHPTSVALFDEFFEFNSLAAGLETRFIELLHPATNHFFRKTSRSNYFNSLDVRGIEVEDLECPTYGDEGCRDTHFEWTGRLSLNLNRVPDEWVGFLVVTGVVRVNAAAFPDPHKLNFVKKHEQLSLTGIPPNFEWFVHPTLKRLQISCDNFNFDQSNAGWSKLAVFGNLEEFFLQISDNILTAESKAFLENLYQQNANSLNDFSLICGDDVFCIHENVLCFCPENGTMVKDYKLDVVVDEDLMLAEDLMDIINNFVWAHLFENVDDGLGNLLDDNWMDGILADDEVVDDYVGDDEDLVDGNAAEGQVMQDDVVDEAAVNADLDDYDVLNDAIDGNQTDASADDDLQDYDLTKDDENHSLESTVMDNAGR